MATAQELIDLAETQLNDEGNVDHSPAELLGYLNEALKVLAGYQPRYFVDREVATLTQGQCRQTIPAGGISFLRALQAVTLAGVAGRALTAFDINTMDSVSPSWRTLTSAPVRQYAPDPVDPKTFWVTPPALGNAEIEYVATPDTLGLGDSLPTPSQFDVPITNYVIGRAYAKDTEYSGEDGRAAYHMSLFTQGASGG